MRALEYFSELHTAVAGCKEDLGHFLRVINFAEMMTPDAEFEGQAKSGVKNEK